MNSLQLCVGLWPFAYHVIQGRRHVGIRGLISSLKLFFILILQFYIIVSCCNCYRLSANNHDPPPYKIPVYASDVATAFWVIVLSDVLTGCLWFVFFFFFTRYRHWWKFSKIPLDHNFWQFFMHWTLTQSMLNRFQSAILHKNVSGDRVRSGKVGFYPVG